MYRARLLSIPYDMVYGAYRYSLLRFFNEKRPFGCSFAPTVKCNLNCKICYEKENRMSGKREMSKEEMAHLAEKLSNLGVKHCTITDGEPLLTRLSREKCETLINTFWVCYLVTNGTIELPDFPTLYIISLDGPARIHNRLRGDGVFQSINRNVKKAPTDFIYGLMTISTGNNRYIKETVATAKTLGLRGIMFNWYTPFSMNDPLWLPYEERRRNIGEIFKLKEKEMEFICNTRFELNLLRSSHWTENCPHWYIISIDAFGNRKERCVFTKKAICERCGCHVFPALLETIKHGKQTVETNLLKDYIKNLWLGI